MVARPERRVFPIWKPGVVVGVSAIGLVHMIAGDPLFVAVDVCVIVAALVYLLPLKNKQEIIRRGIAIGFFAVGVVAALWGDVVVQTWGIFLVVGAMIGMSPDVGEVFGRSAMSLFWGHASKLQPGYGIAKRKMEIGEYDEAIRIFRNYADRDPEDQNVRLQIALTYLGALQRPELAWYWFDKVLEFRRNNENEVIACMEKVKIAISDGRTQEAQSVYLEMLSRFPKHLSTQAARDIIKESSH